jgi:hypothetical protein
MLTEYHLTDPKTRTYIRITYSLKEKSPTIDYSTAGDYFGGDVLGTLST